MKTGLASEPPTRLSVAGIADLFHDAADRAAVNTASLRMPGCLLTLTTAGRSAPLCFEATRTLSGHSFSGKVREGIA
jgi:hypothetical protein